MAFPSASFTRDDELDVKVSYRVCTSLFLKPPPLVSFDFLVGTKRPLRTLQQRLSLRDVGTEDSGVKKSWLVLISSRRRNGHFFLGEKSSGDVS
jgi:hypothetical protein